MGYSLVLQQYFKKEKFMNNELLWSSEVVTSATNIMSEIGFNGELDDFYLFIDDVTELIIVHGGGNEC